MLPSQSPRGPSQTEGKNTTVHFISLRRKPKFLFLSRTAFYKHLQTPSLILTTLHVKMESTRPGADGAE